MSGANASPPGRSHQGMSKVSTAIVRVALVAAMVIPFVPEATTQGARGQGRGQGGRGQAPAAPAGPIRRMADGKPDLTGLYSADAGGANYGLERHASDFLTPGTRGVIVDPPDG